MRSMIKYLLLITMLYLNSLIVEISSVYQYVDGNLVDAWRFDFSIFSEELKGIIFYAIDSRGNQFGMIIPKDLNNKKYIRFSYNQIVKFVLLKNLCGCDKCVNTSLHFNIEFQNKLIKIKCNYKNFEEMSIAGQNQKERVEKSDTLYPIPLTILNKHNKLYIAIGTIGPYKIENNKSVNPLRDKIVGCLDNLFYNRKKITVKNDRGKILPHCQKGCKSDICNGGKCYEMFLKVPFCDCSFVAQNGKYCNKSLKSYVEGNNTYINVKGLKEFKFKISWKPFSDQRYCLMNIRGDSGEVTIWIKDGHLMADRTVVTLVQNEIEFATVIFKDNYLIINAYNNATKIDISYRENVRINVGFSKTDKTCNTFKGQYDFSYNTSEMYLSKESFTGYKILKLRNIRNDTFIIRPTSLPSRSQQNQVFSQLMVIIFVASISIISFLLCVALFVKVFYKKNKTSARIEKVSVSDNFTHIEKKEESEYSGIDYKVINVDDNDGYDVPTPKEKVEILPPLPPRNYEESEISIKS